MTSDVDLGQLRILQDLLRTKSTTVTARRVGCTQSSVSHSLARLRERFGDPLLVRNGRQLAPTRFAEDLRPRLDVALGHVGSLFEATPAFSPRTLQRAFRFAGTDFSELLLLPLIVRRLARDAPLVDLVCSAAGADVERQIQEREVDLAFATLFRDRAGVMTKKISVDELVLVMRDAHPLRRRLDLASYVAARHVLVAPRGAPGGVIDVALGRLDKTRRVAVQVGNFTTAATLVAESDLVTAMPRSVAVRMAKRLPLLVRPLPVSVAPFTFALAWNDQLTRDSAHKWFRGVVEDAAVTAFQSDS